MTLGYLEELGGLHGTMNEDIGNVTELKLMQIALAVTVVVLYYNCQY